MDEKLKIVLAWIVVVIFGIPLLLSLLGISFLNLIGLAIVVWAILLLYKKYNLTGHHPYSRLLTSTR